MSPQAGVRLRDDGMTLDVIDYAPRERRPLMAHVHALAAWLALCAFGLCIGYGLGLLALRQWGLQ